MPSLTPLGEPSTQNPFEDTSWLPKEIEKLLNMKSQMTISKFKFEVNPEAASFNFNLLRDNNFDLDSLLNPPVRCMTSYGSEFKTAEELEGLLARHPRWEALRDKLSKGCEYPLEDITEEQRVLDLRERLERGNHKSASRHEDFLSKAMEKEVKKGWAIIINEEDALKIPSLEIAPLGVAEHLGISETGE